MLGTASGCLLVLGITFLYYIRAGYSTSISGGDSLSHSSSVYLCLTTFFLPNQSGCHCCICSKWSLHVCSDRPMAAAPQLLPPFCYQAIRPGGTLCATTVSQQLRHFPNFLQQLACSRCGFARPIAALASSPLLACRLHTAWAPARCHLAHLVGGVTCSHASRARVHMTPTERSHVRCQPVMLHAAPSALCQMPGSQHVSTDRHHQQLACRCR